MMRTIHQQDELRAFTNGKFEQLSFQIQRKLGRTRWKTHDFHPFLVQHALEEALLEVFNDLEPVYNTYF